MRKVKFLLVFLTAILLLTSLVYGFGRQNRTDKLHPFFVYTFGGLKELSVEKQVNLLKKLGYSGLAIEVSTLDDLTRLSEYIRYTGNRKDFKIFSVFVRFNFNNKYADRNRWKAVVDKIRKLDINLWVILGPATPGVTDHSVDSVLRNINSYAEVNKVQVTLYPHSFTYVATAEQALPFVKQINSPNLKLAIHLCHEVRAGNAARIGEVVKNVKGYISYATICGSDSIADFSDPVKMDTSTIKPLDRGNYDVRQFLRALKDNGFDGPVGFINFKISEEPEAYLSRSMTVWKLWRQEIDN